jgi:hypothetical protein
MTTPLPPNDGDAWITILEQNQGGTLTRSDDVG